MRDFEQWTADWIEGELGYDQAKLLRQRLENDPVARRRFAELARDHRALRTLLAPEPAGRFAASVEHALDCALPGDNDDRDVLARRRFSPFARMRQVALAAAALFLLALGVGILMRHASPAGPTSVATVSDLRGAAAVRSEHDAVDRALQVGSVLRAGENVSVAGSGYAQLTLADGSVVDVNEETRVRLSSESESAALRLESGALYIAVAPRGPNEAPFSIESANGHRAEALGTRFELRTLGDETTLRVETGTVRLRAGDTDVILTALMQATAKGSEVGSPEGIMAYELAAWKFRPQAVPEGTVLFEDDFEDGLERWDVWYGHAEIVDGKGVNGSRALRLTWDQGARTAVMPAFISRHPNFEMSLMIRLPFTGKYVLGSHVGRPDWRPESGQATRSKVLDARIYGTARHGRWLRMHVIVRGRVKHTRLWQDKTLLSEAKVEVLDPFSAVGLYSDETGKNTLYLDNVTIRKLAD